MKTMTIKKTLSELRWDELAAIEMDRHANDRTAKAIAELEREPNSKGWQEQKNAWMAVLRKTRAHLKACEQAIIDAS